MAVNIDMASWVLGGFTFQNNHYNTNSGTLFRINYSQATATDHTLAQWQGLGLDTFGFHASRGLGIDPLFTSYRGNDFHLQSSSPDRDTGISLANYFTLDKDKVLRPQGSAWAIGAYEYIPGGDTTPPATPTGLSVR